MMRNGEILQLPLAQLLTDHSARAGAVQIQPQEIRFTAFPLPSFTRLLMTAGSTMPALAFHLLTQILLQLKR